MISNKGFSVLEILVAAGMFLIIASSAVVGIVSGLSVNRLASDEIAAVHYATEGLEAARSIKNTLDFTSFSTPSSAIGVVKNLQNVWVWAGTNNTFDNGKYTRQITTTSVDANTEKVTSTVTWNYLPGQSKSVDATTYLTNWKSSIAALSGPIMMVYSKTTSTPFYRIWDGTTWGAEATANNVGGNINYVVLKSARTRNEAILGTIDSTGAIYVQIWNGTTWSTPTQIGTGLAAYRGLDIEYEKNSDNAVIVYLPTATGVDPAYRTWNGTTLSGQTVISTPPTTGIVRWIDLAQNPNSSSNEIAMIMLDANTDIYGMNWSGSSWGNMGDAAVWDATGSTPNYKSIAVAYEQNSGEALFIWGDSVATDQYYRTWNGTTLSSQTLLDIPASGGVINWAILASRPGSDQIMFAGADAGSDLNSRIWSGTAWDTATQHAEHAATLENLTSKVFDIVWETHSSNLGKAWILWGTTTNIFKKQWSGTAWGAGSALTGSDDTSLIRLKADPISGAIFAGLYEDSSSATDDIWESRLTGGGTAWTAKNTIWGGPTGGTPVYFRVDIATP